MHFSEANVSPLRCLHLNAFERQGAKSENGKGMSIVTMAGLGKFVMKWGVGSTTLLNLVSLVSYSLSPSSSVLLSSFLPPSSHSSSSSPSLSFLPSFLPFLLPHFHILFSKNAARIIQLGRGGTRLAWRRGGGAAERSGREGKLELLEAHDEMQSKRKSGIETQEIPE